MMTFSMNAVTRSDHAFACGVGISEVTFEVQAQCLVGLTAYGTKYGDGVSGGRYENGVVNGEVAPSEPGADYLKIVMLRP